MTTREHDRRLALPTATRRGLLAGAAGVAGSLLVGPMSLRAGTPADITKGPHEPILKKGDRVSIDEDPETLLQRAYDLGHQYEGKYGGCSQCTVAALQDALPFVPKDVDVFRAASALDGGSAPVNVQNCGGFTGAAMILGYLTGRTRTEKGFTGGKGLSHNLSHRLYERFKEHYGTVLCRDVRKGAGGDCPKVVGQSARWTAEILLAEFAPKA